VIGPRASSSRWGLVFIYMAVLFVFSSIPNPPALPRSGSDKLIHATLYAGLGLVTLRALAQGRWHDVAFTHSIGALLIAIAYGAFDEFHQSFVAGRRSSLDDLAADALGSCAAAGAVWVWSILTKKMANRTQKPEARRQDGRS
jgi:VanZ family protein